MSNNYFNFKIPDFNEKYGVDWDSFKTIVDSNVDNVINKTYQLYWLNNPNYFTTQVAEIVLRSLGIEFSATDTLQTKKIKIRTFLTQYKKKGLEDLYLDIGEEIAGTRGVIYTSLSSLTFLWGTSRWATTGTIDPATSIRWLSEAARFYIYIDVKTTDSGELDQIQSLMQADSMKPAFYQVYLIDSSFNVLRTI